MSTLFPPRRLPRAFLLFAACGTIAFLLSCGGGDDTVTPTNNEPPVNNDIPAVPNMTNPDVDPPTRSKTISVMRKASDFAPLVDAAYCDWTITGRGRFETLSGGWVDCYGSWADLYSGKAWSYGANALPSYHGCFGACMLVTAYCPDSWELAIDNWPETARFVFVKDNVMDPMPNTAEWDAPEVGICRERLFGECISKAWITVRYKGTGQPVTKTPYIRRERFWVATPWQSGALVERTTGNETITLTSTYTHGCSQTETESFAWSLGASVGAEYKALKASVEGSITKTFEKSFTVMEQEQVSISKALQGEAGKRTCFVLWTLYEQYSFVDQNGNAYADPNYVFDPGFYDAGGDKYYAFRYCGTQYEIGKYVFNLTTNALESEEYIAVR